MNSKRPLAPRFLNDLDDRLLRNHPDTWSTRTHLVVYYCFLFLLAIGVAGFLTPTDPRLNSSVAFWTTIVSIIVVIGMVVWMIFLLRFNVFKRFGFQSHWSGLKAFILYFISFSALVALPFIPSLIEMCRARMAYDQNEVVRDINQMNIDLCLLEKDSMVLDWEPTYYHLSPKKEPDTVVYYKYQRVQFVESAEYNRFRNLADSLVIISDSMFASFECPQIAFVEAWRSGYIDEHALSSLELYRKVFQPYRAPDRARVQAELRGLINKYKTENASEDSYVGEYSTKPKAEFLAKIRSRYGIFNVNNSLNNIFSKQFNWDEESTTWMIRLFYYLVLGLTLLLFAFRHSTTKTYFLSWLAGAILAIFTGTIIGTTGGSFVTFLVMLVVYFVFFLGIAKVANSGPVRNAVGGISLNLALFLTPFLPLIITSIVYEIMEDRARSSDTYMAEDFYQKYFHLTIAEVAGFILLLIVVEPLFKRMYRKWYAQPED